MGLSLIGITTEKQERIESVIRTLEEMLDRAYDGEIESVEIIFSSIGGGWGTTASTSIDCRSSAAMLMELAIRRLGFGGG
jgi:predicted sugar kinase